jgi:eukaryotic-like serine/threonine-protein kinase
MDNFLRQTASGSDGDSGQAPGPAIPPTLDGYRTGRLLGTGGNARVWLVENQRTGAVRALKVLHRDHARPGDEPYARDELLAQLRRENAVLGTLRHPHLLGMHGVVPTDQGPALLTDYAAGGSLHNLVVARGRLTPGECITVLAPIGQALSYLHSSSVSHGDISPGNVLFTAEGMPMIGDLGSARLLGEKTRGAIGTVGFSAAVTSNEPSSGSAGDVYSLAALGWYGLTGKVPGPAKDRVPLSLLVPEVSAEMLHALESGLQEPRSRLTW